MLSSVIFSQADELVDVTAEESAEIAINAGPDLIPLPELVAHTTGDVNYISGGIGQGEAAKIKQLAKSYLLEIVCVQRASGTESYIANVKVAIVDAKGNIVLDIVTEGPYLLVNLPRGSYIVSADCNSVIKHGRVSITRQT